MVIFMERSYGYVMCQCRHPSFDNYTLASFVIPRFVIRERDMKQPRKILEIPASSQPLLDLEIFPVGFLSITQK